MRGQKVSRLWLQFFIEGTDLVGIAIEPKRKVSPEGKQSIARVSNPSAGNR